MSYADGGQRWRVSKKLDWFTSFGENAKGVFGKKSTSQRRRVFDQLTESSRARAKGNEAGGVKDPQQPASKFLYSNVRSSQPSHGNMLGRSVSVCVRGETHSGLQQIATAPAKFPNRRHGQRRALASVGSAVATCAKSQQVRQRNSVKYDAARSISSPSEGHQFVGAAPRHRGRTGRGTPVECRRGCGRCQDLGSTLRYDGVRWMYGYDGVQWPKTQRNDQCIRALVETRTENGLGDKIC